MSDIKDFKLPDLGEDLEEGEIVEWLVEVGDTIDLNQKVASIETAKAVVEVPSPYAGEVVELIREPGDTIEVGSVFVRMTSTSRGRTGTAPLRRQLLKPSPSSNCSSNTEPPSRRCTNSAAKR